MMDVGDAPGTYKSPLVRSQRPTSNDGRDLVVVVCHLFEIRSDGTQRCLHRPRPRLHGRRTESTDFRTPEDRPLQLLGCPPFGFVFRCAFFNASCVVLANTRPGCCIPIVFATNLSLTNLEAIHLGRFPADPDADAVLLHHGLPRTAVRSADVGLKLPGGDSCVARRQWRLQPAAKGVGDLYQVGARFRARTAASRTPAELAGGKTTCNVLAARP